MAALADRVRDTSTTTGTGTFTVTGTAPSTYIAWDGTGGYAVGDSVPYCIGHQSANEFEVGRGILVTATTISRSATDVISGSSGVGVLVNFSAGTKDVFSTLNAQDATTLGVTQALAMYGNY